MTEDLAYALDQLRGFNADLDAIADRIEALATRTYTRRERMETIARLAGNHEDDLITAIALLAKELTVVPADQAMGDTDRKTAEQHGQDIALLYTDPDLHQPAAAAAALIEPTN